jgi:hypothetical protein
VSAVTKEPPPPPEILTEIQAVVESAMRGDTASVPRLRELLNEHPALWEHVGNLAEQAEHAWIFLAAEDNLHLRECLLKQVEAMRKEFIGESPSPVARLLAERVIITWLQSCYFDCIEAQALLKDESPKLAAYRAKRQAQAHRSHLSAIAAWTMLRKLLPVPVAAITTAAAPKPSAANGAAAKRNGRHSNGQVIKGRPPEGAFDPHNRIADLLAQVQGGAEPKSAGKRETVLCGTEG